MKFPPLGMGMGMGIGRTGGCGRTGEDYDDDDRLTGNRTRDGEGWMDDNRS